MPFSRKSLGRAGFVSHLAVLGMGCVLFGAGTLYADSPKENSVSDINFPATFEAPGVLTGGPDGRLFPPGVRVRPDPNTLEPAGRWLPPGDVLAKIPSGHYLELSNTTTVHDKGTPIPAPMPADAKPAWRLVIERAADDASPAPEVSVSYLAGPGRCSQAVVRWDGTQILAFDSSAKNWIIQTSKIKIPAFAAGRHVLEIADGADAKSIAELPHSLLLTNLHFSSPVRLAGPSVALKLPSGGDALVAVTAGKEPVRLWTIGYANQSDTEFIRGQTVAATVGAAPARTLPDGYDGSLRRTLFPIRRNPDGSQVEDFTAAEFRIYSPVNARYAVATEFTIEFESPIAGEATLVGQIKSGNGWRVTCAGQSIDQPKSKDFESAKVPGLKIVQGMNRITIESLATPAGEEWDWPGTTWDWLGLDFADASASTAAPSAAGFPLERAVAVAVDNPPIEVDPRKRVSVDGFTEIQNRLFGLTTHNGPDFLHKSAGMAKYVAECRFAASKGADGIMYSEPKEPLSNVASLKSYYASQTPVQAYKKFPYNDGSDQLARTVRKFGWDPLVMGQGLPEWMLVKQGKGWNVPPKDFAMASEAVLGAIKTARANNWPEVNSMYVWNEPDAGWWKADKADLDRHGGGTGTYFAAYTNVLGPTLHAAIPKMQIFAPTTYDAPFSDKGGTAVLSRFHTWYEPLIATAWDQMAGFDFHFYGLDAAEIMANAQTLQALTQNKYGQTKPLIITESNYATPVAPGSDSPRQSPDGWFERALPYSRYLVAMASQPNLLQRNMVHDLMANSYGLFVYDGCEITPVSEVFHTLAPLRGTLLGGDPLNTKQTWAASRENGMLVVAVVTTVDNGGSIELSLPKTADLAFNVLQLHFNDAAGRLVETTTTAKSVNGQLKLPPMPGSVIVLTAMLPGGQAVANQEQIVTDFAKGDPLPLDNRTPSLKWGLAVKQPPSPAATYRLRIATFTTEAVDHLVVTFNGQPVQPAGHFTSECTIPADAVKPSNTVTVALADPKQKAPIVVGSIQLTRTETVPANTTAAQADR